MLWAIVPVVSAQDWELVWSDEFDADSINASKWQHEVNARGGGNNELQFYTDRPENSFVDGGVLVIEARNEVFTGDDGTRDYTSARLRTKRMGDWTYGRFEVRARMPSGIGLWPAIWLLPTDREYGVWAASGEIDIVEMDGEAPDEVFGTIHYGRPWPQNVSTGESFEISGSTFADDFHTFAIEWEPDAIRWFVDDSLYQEQSDWYSSGGDPPAPFDRRFHLILSLSVGGYLPGPPDASTSFPQRLEIDYVRVYQEKGTSPAIQIEQPADGSSFESGSTIVLIADASSADSEVRSVVFEQGEAVLARVDSPPYEFAIPFAQPGCYEIQARVTDAEGRVAQDGPISFDVGDGCGQGPYLIQAAAVPGRIEAEYFDLGGSGIAYTDTEDRNIGLEMRASDGVDIEYTADAGGGHNVGWIESGEWLEYTVDVAQSGEYEVSVRVASEQAGGQIAVEIGETRLSETFGATGGWQNWLTVPIGRVNLEVGIQSVRLVFESSLFNVNWINLERVGDPTSTSAEVPTERTLSVETFPNPGIEMVRIRVTDLKNRELVVDLLDLLGRPVKRLFDGLPSSEEVEIQAELTGLAGGAYVVRVKAGDERVESVLLKGM